MKYGVAGITVGFIAGAAMKLYGVPYDTVWYSFGFIAIVLAGGALLGSDGCAHKTIGALIIGFAGPTLLSAELAYNVLTHGFSAISLVFFIRAGLIMMLLGCDEAMMAKVKAACAQTAHENKRIIAQPMPRSRQRDDEAIPAEWPFVPRREWEHVEKKHR